MCDCKVLGNFHVWKTEKITRSSHTLLKPFLFFPGFTWFLKTKPRSALRKHPTTVSLMLLSFCTNKRKERKCFHHPAIYSNIPTLMEIFILIIIINIIMITIIYFYFCLFFHLTYSRRASTLPSGLLWSLRIPPSLPGSRLTIF